MSMVLNAGDTISGKMGKAVMNLNGSIEDLFMAKKVEAKTTIKKNTIYAIGTRATQHKAVGWEGKGTLTMFMFTSVFRNLVKQFSKTGVMPFFDLTVINDDPNSTIGRQTVVLYNCLLDDSIIARLDVGTDELEDEVSFTFDDFDILDSFKKAKPIQR
ncbi:MAG: phage tail tube protein [Bacillota bacterium]|nr:phage tail tube protein [Bacillota bacterium]